MGSFLKLLLDLVIDGFNPKLNPIGTHVTCGASEITCWEISSGNLIFKSPGRQAGWLDNYNFTYLEDIDDSNALMWQYNILSGMEYQVPIDPTLIAFNEFRVSEDNWAGWRSENSSLVYNGEKLVGFYSGVDLRDEFLLSTKDNEFQLIRNEVLWKTFHRPLESNLFFLGHFGDIYYGYFGPTRVIRAESGVIEDLTITPWKLESPIHDVVYWDRKWYFSATQTPSGKFWVLGREPSDVDKAIIIENCPAVQFDVIFNQQFILAAADDRGRLRVFQFSEDTPKRKVSEDMPINPPGITIDSYDKILTKDNHWKLKWHDRNNPGYSGEFEFISSSVHAGITNPAGSDHSGMQRKVQMGGGQNPGPLPPFPNPIPPGSLIDWRGNFLCFPGFEYAFMYPAWSDQKRLDFRTAYTQAGLTHLPLSPWAKYPGHGQYDFSQNPEQFNSILDELINVGMIPCLMAFTGSFEDWHPKTLPDLKNWASLYYPQLGDRIKLLSTGWEFNDIEPWTGDGAKHIEWGKHLRQLFPFATIYAHFTPGRITGYPNYPDHSGPQDEKSWWVDSEGIINGLLSQRSPNEPIQYTLAHTIGGTDESGGHDVGDAERIAGSYWGLSGRLFTFFEHSRDINRWNAIWNAIKSDSRVKGTC